MIAWCWLLGHRMSEIQELWSAGEHARTVQLRAWCRRLECTHSVTYDGLAITLGNRREWLEGVLRSEDRALWQRLWEWLRRDRGRGRLRKSGAPGKACGAAHGPQVGTSPPTSLPLKRRNG